MAYFLMLPRETGGRKACGQSGCHLLTCMTRSYGRAEPALPPVQAKQATLVQVFEPRRRSGWKASPASWLHQLGPRRACGYSGTEWLATAAKVGHWCFDPIAKGQKGIDGMASVAGDAGRPCGNKRHPLQQCCLGRWVEHFFVGFYFSLYWWNRGAH